jgi:nitrite reductase/ring-hydroxylating ferredoxin subunit
MLQGDAVMAEVFIAKKDEMRDGDRLLVEADDYEVGVYRHNGKYYAYRSVCVHQGGPACEGIVIAKVEDVLGPDKSYIRQRFDETDPHIVCPWHGYEYRLLTGECAANPRLGLKRHEIVERDGNVYVVL